jgi:hypothetical protein
MQQADPLERLQAYWEDRRRGRRFPARADIDPMDFRYALGRVSLVDCRAESPQFRYRLVSTELTETLGYEMTGRYAEDIPEPQVRDYVLGLYQRAVAAAAPMRNDGGDVLDGRLWRFRFPGAAVLRGWRGYQHAAGLPRGVDRPWRGDAAARKSGIALTPSTVMRRRMEQAHDDP